MSTGNQAAHVGPAHGTPAPSRGVWRDVVLVTVVALAVRLAYYLVNSRGNPAFDYPIMDSMYIDRWAKALAAGSAEPSVFFRGPLYPYFLGILYKVAGANISVAVVANHLMGAVTGGLVVLLGREYFTRAVSLTAGLVYALYWPFIYFEGEILVEPMSIALLVLALWRTARAAAVPTVTRLGVAGATLGLAALARPTILALIVVLPWVFLAARRVSGPKAPSRIRDGLLPAAIVVVTCALVLAPATIHNWRAARALVPVAWSGGLNLYIGNNADADGRSAVIPFAQSPWMGGEDEALAIASEQAGRPLTPAQASSFFAGRALDFFASQPLAAAALMLQKVHYFWEGPERSNEKYIYFFWNRYGLGRVPMPGFWLVAPLAIAGLLRLWPRRREFSLLYGFVAVYMLAVVAFFVVARLRLPAVPVLILFASWAAVDLLAAARARNRVRLAKNLVVVAAAFLFANAGYPRFVLQRPSHEIISHYLLAGAMMEEQDTDGAMVELARARMAFEKAPADQYTGIAQDVYFKLGTLLYERNRCKEAADALGRIQPGDPRAGAARLMFADCCEKLGRFAEAGKAYQMILRTEPDNRRVLEGLVRCLEATGSYDEAARIRAGIPAP